MGGWKRGMYFKIVKNDFLRKKVITITVFVFITLAVLLGASATNIIANLVQSIQELAQCAEPSDITQMHAGDLDQSEIDRFTEAHKEDIMFQETMVLLNIEGINIHFGNQETMAGTVQDISFVVQNQKFDFILDLNNQKLEMKNGEIACPIYFMQEYDLEIGDVITVEVGDFKKEFVITEYARDFEMNSSLTSSKRFVISQDDYDEMMEKEVGEIEYLIEFKMREGGDTKAVQTAYIDEKLPANGPTVGGTLFMLFDALSDAAVAMIIILISILLIIIAALCIRLTFLATIDEDMREIGVMKAMGIPKKNIKKVYLNKYRIMSVAAGVTGYLLSFVIVNLFTANMRLYISSDLSGSLKYLLSLLAPIFVYFMIVLYCKKVLRRIDKITAVEALRSGIIDQKKNKKYKCPLRKNKLFSTNVYMGVRDVWRRMNLYRLLIIIFIVCTFLVILPLNVYNTMNSPEFSTYMGIGKCDMRIDLRKTDTITEDFNALQEDLKKDKDIKKSAAFITCSYQVKNADNEWDYINIEIGDFSVFPLKYLKGKAPEASGEISLSYANADELNKKIGDEVIVRVGNEEKSMKVCGIYQDITNGGKTAKATSDLKLNENSVLWYIICLDLESGVEKQVKMDYFRSTYDSSQVNDIQEYTKQTLGNIIDQMKVLVIAGIAIAAVIAILITALFLKMLLSKDMSQIAIMRSIGLTLNNIREQYMAGTMIVLIVGIILGVIAAQYLGEVLVSLAMSTMGAARIQFILNIWQVWLICPIAFILIVGITISICCKVVSKDDLSVVLRS